MNRKTLTSIKNKSLMIGAMALAMTLSACGNETVDVNTNNAEPIVAIAAPAGTEWAQTVSQTPAGGYIMGNPDAPIKLVEFASLTCGHCADFSAEAFEDIRDNYVNTGRVSFELRNFVRDPMDLTTAMLTRCGADTSFFALTEQAMANQANMFEKAQAMGEERYTAILAMPDAERYKALAEQVGLIEFFGQRGLSRDQANTCLANVEAANALANNTGTATQEYDLTGTPTFLINNQKVDFTGWAELETKLQQLGAR